MTADQKAILASTPGRILEEEFLKGFGLSQAELSRRTGIPRSTINEIIKGRRPIQAEVAYALGLFFRMDPQFWINLQSRYDMEIAKDLLADRLETTVHPLRPAA